MDLQRMLPSDPIADSICSVTRTLRCFLNRGSTCINRTLRMREWLTDFLTDAMALGGISHPCFSHSSSLGNKMQPQLAVRACKYIVTGKEEERWERKGKRIENGAKKRRWCMYACTRRDTFQSGRSRKDTRSPIVRYQRG